MTRRSLLFFVGIILLLSATAILASFSKQKQNLQQDADSKPTASPLPVSDKVTLTKDEEVNLPNTPLTLTLTEVTIPPPRCRDCITGAKVIVRKNSEEKVIEFKSGGIAGIIQDTQEVFGFVFTLKGIEENTITLSYTKQ